MSAEQIVDEDPLDRTHRFVGDPVAAYLVWAESSGGQPVGIQTARLHPFQPASLDDVDATCVALAEEPFTIFGCSGRYRPDAPSRAVPREPESRRVARVNRPDQRRFPGIGDRGVRLELAKRWILAEVPQSEGTLPLVWGRRFPVQQVLRIVSVHESSIAQTAPASPRSNAPISRSCVRSVGGTPGLQFGLEPVPHFRGCMLDQSCERFADLLVAGKVTV
jgi:hypothetical protein